MNRRRAIAMSLFTATETRKIRSAQESRVMANRKNKGVDRERCKPSMALNAICPYYTMFPLSFPISVLGTFGKRKLRVADPFCGRGTTIFAARLKGHQAYGIDSSPIAIAIARAKLAETTDEEVLDLADRILESQPKVRLPKGEFWEWAYDANTLNDVCILREGLRKPHQQATWFRAQSNSLGEEVRIVT
jgi:hypothetical protein